MLFFSLQTSHFSPAAQTASPHFLKGEPAGHADLHLLYHNKNRQLQHGFER
jgi:hypothetical protein